MASEPPQAVEYLIPRPPLDGPVHLADPDPTWPEQYAARAALIRQALGDRVLVLEHAGSTSVPGLAAKPIIDVVLAVADPADESAYVPDLEAVGFALHLREPDWHEHRLLRGVDPAVNLHVFGPEAAEIRRMVAFRDRLRTHPEELERYQATKRELAARTWEHVQQYADAKSEIVEAIIARAQAGGEVAPTQIVVDVPGGRLVGRRVGRGAPVLLLHGGPAIPATYLDGLLGELIELEVVTYQQRGLAPSTVEGPMTVEQHVADAVAVLDSLGWDAPAVIGHSWGGHLLLHLLASHPERVGAAVVVDTLGGTEDGGMADFGEELMRRAPEPARPRLAELEALEEARRLTDADALEQNRILWPGYFSSPELAPPYPLTRLSVAAFQATMDSALEALPALAARLSGSAVPVRFVHGQESPIPVTAATDTAALMDARVDVLSPCGHLPWLEQPGAVRRALDALLRRDGIRGRVPG